MGACIKRDAKISHIHTEPGWQNFILPTAGFTPVHLAVNCKKASILESLLEAGADSNDYSGPLKKKFPVRIRLTGEIGEYQWNGHRYTPLHMAVLMDDAVACSILLQGVKQTDRGTYKRITADVNIRVRPGFVRDQTHIEERLNREEDRLNCLELNLAMCTPLHLAPLDSVVTSILLSKGANLLVVGIGGVVVTA